MTFLAFVFLPSLGLACPPVLQSAPERMALLADLQTSHSQEEGREAIKALWVFWKTAPDAHAQSLLDEGSYQILLADYDRAIELFDELIAYCPAFSEGYNQRGYALFLRNDLHDSLRDMNRVLAFEPEHFGALSGKGLIFLRLGHDALARTFIRRAAEVNPWLSEKALLTRQDGNGEL